MVVWRIIIEFYGFRHTTNFRFRARVRVHAWSVFFQTGSAQTCNISCSRLRKKDNRLHNASIMANYVQTVNLGTEPPRRPVNTKPCTPRTVPCTRNCARDQNRNPTRCFHSHTARSWSRTDPCALSVNGEKGGGVIPGGRNQLCSETIAFRNNCLEESPEIRPPNLQNSTVGWAWARC